MKFRPPWYRAKQLRLLWQITVAKSLASFFSSTDSYQLDERGERKIALMNSV
jgi:hypothetical protein